MNAYQQQPQQNGFGLQDILFVMFKHKWKILLCSMLGLTAAAIVFIRQRPSYETDAKMLVRYVIERSAVDPYESREEAAGARSDGSVITTEMEILSSWDLATDVARKIGVERLLNDPSIQISSMTKEEAESEAVGGILKSLKITSTKGSNVIHASYSNPDPTISIEVLRELVHRYFDKHLEIHRSIGAFDYVATQADQARSRLRETEMELNRMKTESGIMSLDGSTNSLEQQRSRVNEQLFEAEAELVEQKARLDSLEQALGKPDSATENPNSAVKPDAVTVSDYAAVVERIRALRQRRMDLLTKYTESNTQVSLLQQQIATYEGQKRDLLKKSPGLVVTSGEGGAAATPATDIVAERARYAAALAKVDTLKGQSSAINQRSEQFAATAFKISELERKKQIEEEKYRYLNTSLEKARTDTALDPSKMPNISMVQNPSSPVKVYDKRTKKLVAGLAGGGIALGIGLSLLLELVLDRRVKRPIEIEARLQVPLMLSIPYVKMRNRGALLLPHDQGLLTYNGDGNHAMPLSRTGDQYYGNHESNEHFIMPYAEAIRDRLLFNFAINNINHKPKLVAFTSLSSGAGASTLAVGLAKSLSETEGAKILLVDLNGGSGHSCEDEHTSHSLSGALQLAQSDRFRGQKHRVYYATASARRNGNGSATFMPKHLHDLIPQFQASDFDYIIFDMPPIEQTSPTLVMAGLMDKVLLVLDAEDTSREGLKWGYSELMKCHADVSCIFNKARIHAPRWVAGELV